MQAGQIGHESTNTVCSGVYFKLRNNWTFSCWNANFEVFLAIGDAASIPQHSKQEEFYKNNDS